MRKYGLALILPAKFMAQSGIRPVVRSLKAITTELKFLLPGTLLIRMYLIYIILSFSRYVDGFCHSCILEQSGICQERKRGLSML